MLFYSLACGWLVMIIGTCLTFVRGICPMLAMQCPDYQAVRSDYPCILEHTLNLLALHITESSVNELHVLPHENLQVYDDRCS